MRYFRHNKIILATALLIFAILVGCSPKKVTTGTEPPLIPVQVVSPKKQKYRQTLTFSGITEPPKATQVSFLVAGKVKKLMFDVGDKVKKGEILGILDPKTYEAQVKIAESQLNLAYANLVKVKTGARKEDIEAAKYSMLQAKAQMELAKKEYKRIKAVYKMDAVPKQQYDQVKTQYKIAKKQYEIAKKQYQKIKKGPTPEDINIYKANVEVAKNSLKQAKIQLEYTILKSPIDGIIAQKLVEEGCVVNAGTPVYQILAEEGMDFVINIPSVYIDKIKIGTKAVVEFSSNGNKKVAGRVYQIRPVSDPMARSYQVKLRLSKVPFKRKYAGVIGKAVFSLTSQIEGYFAPISCLMKDSQGNFYVYVIEEGNVAHKVDVNIGKMQDERVLLSGKFPENAKIVISGQEYLKEGSKVRIVEALGAEKFVSPNRNKEE